MSEPSKKPRNSIESFQVRHIEKVAVPHKIRAAFAKMKELGEAWLYQSDFSKLSEVQPRELNLYVDEFKEQTHELGNSSRSKLVWFVTPEAKFKALNPGEPLPQKKARK